MARKCHQWGEADNIALLRAVDECRPLFEHYPEQGESYSSDDAWGAVAGRMLPEVVVTGLACKRQWQRLRREQEEAEAAADKATRTHSDPESVDSWNRLAAFIDEYEASALERIEQHAEEIAPRLRRVEGMLAALCREWGVPIPADGEVQ